MKTLKGVLAEAPLAWLLIAVPIAGWLHYARPQNPLLVFIMACVAIIPLAGMLGLATEKLATRVGDAVGGFLNATLGNAAELIIAIVALRAGLLDVVQASITGSIIGNLLLVLGAAFLAGGLRYPVQTFETMGTRAQVGMMALAAMAILIPSIIASIGGGKFVAQSVNFSIIVSVILLAVYLLSLVFSLGTHVHLFRGNPAAAEAEAEEHGEPWSMSLAIGVMAVVTLLIIWMSEILVGTVEHAGQALGLTNLFIGVVVVAVVGNAAEHSTAVLMAMRNRMEIAISVAVGSTTQIALFVAPLLVLLSLLIAPTPMSFAFAPVEVFLVVAATFVASILLVDGRSTWFVGVQLLAVYLVMAITVFGVPAKP